MSGVNYKILKDKIIVEYEVNKISRDNYEKEINEITSNIMNLTEDQVSEKLSSIILNECVFEIEDVIELVNKTGINLEIKEDSGKVIFEVKFDPESEKSFKLAELIAVGIARLPLHKFESLSAQLNQ